MRKLASYCLLCFSLGLFSLNVNAQFSLDKYRIVLDDSQRRTDLRLINNSDDFGSYRVQLVDMEMDENGQLKPTESYEYSAKQLVRVGPRLSKNVSPNAYQKLRVRARGAKAPGEYRSHLLIEEMLPPYQGDVQGMVMRPNLKVIIPVFVVSGELTGSVSADAFAWDAKEKQLNFTLKREGNRSMFGNIAIATADGVEVFRRNGVGIYREVDQLNMSAVLPESISSMTGLVFKFENPDDETVVFQRSL